MSAILIDHFDGDPDDFYTLLTQEVEAYGIPDVEFGWETEARDVGGGGFFKAPQTEEARCLVVKDKVSRALVLAYRFGPHFFVQTRSGMFASVEAKSKQDEHNWEYLDNVRTSCFDELVGRAVKKALTKYLEDKQATVPDALKPENVFIVGE